LGRARTSVRAIHSFDQVLVGTGTLHRGSQPRRRERDHKPSEHMFDCQVGREKQLGPHRSMGTVFAPTRGRRHWGPASLRAYTRSRNTGELGAPG
jgi:hypothetical protein